MSLQPQSQEQNKFENENKGKNEGENEGEMEEENNDQKGRTEEAKETVNTEKNGKIEFVRPISVSPIWESLYEDQSTGKSVSHPLSASYDQCFQGF